MAEDAFWKNYYRFGYLDLADKIGFFSEPFETFRLKVLVFPGQLVIGPRATASSYTAANMASGHLALDDTGMRLFATSTGAVRWNVAKVAVDKVYTIPYKLRTIEKPIQLPGTVIVENSLMEGVSLKASGDVYVLGDVTGASITAGDSIYVRHGVVNKSRLTAGRHVYCDFVENSSITTKGDAWIRDSVHLSQLKCAGRVVVFGEKQDGLISGEILAGREVRAGRIGFAGQKLVITIKPKDCRQVGLTFEDGVDILNAFKKGDTRSREGDLYTSVLINFYKQLLLMDRQKSALVQVTATTTTRRGVSLVFDAARFKTSRDSGSGTWRPSKDGASLELLPAVKDNGDETPVALKFKKPTAEEQRPPDGQSRKNIVKRRKDMPKVEEINRIFGEHPSAPVQILPASDEMVRVVMGHPADTRDALAAMFDPSASQPKPVSVNCKTVRDGVEAVSKQTGVPARELGHRILEEGRGGAMPFKIEVFIKSIDPENLAKAAAAALEPPELVIGEGSDRYELENTEDGLFLTVSGLININTIKNAMSTRGYRDQIDEDLVKRVVAEKSGQPVRVGPQQRDLRDGQFQLKVSEDKLRARLEIEPEVEGGKPVSEELVLTAIANSGIQMICSEQDVLAFMRAGQFTKPLEIARGRSAVAGRDAEVELVYLDHAKKEDLISTGDEEAAVGFKSAFQLCRIHKDDLLVRLRSSSPGSPGIDVYGNEVVPPAVEEKKLSPGRNVRVSSDSDKYFSDIDGNVSVQEDTIHVDDVLIVRKDVDATTGDVQFEGTVVVKGVIREGFKVRATADISAQTIERAIVEANGSVMVTAGIVGSAETYVRAGEDIFARFVENAVIEAKNNVVVTDSILHSTVRAGNNIVVRGGQHRMIVGGSIEAGLNVEAGVIGSDVGANTVVMVGHDPWVGVQMRKLSEQIAVAKAELETVDQGIESINKRQSAKRPDEALTRMLERLQVSRNEALSKLAEMYERKDRLEKTPAAVKADAGVYVRDKVTPGVTLHVINGLMRITKTFHCSGFYAEGAGKEIEIVPFKEIKVETTLDRLKK